MLTYAQALARVERAASGLRARRRRAGRPCARHRAQHRRLPADVVRAHGGRRDPGAGQPGRAPTPSSPASSRRSHRARSSPTPSSRRVVVRRAVVDADGASGRADGRPDDSTDVAVMIPTSGTTGRSKLVMQTHLAYVMAGEGFPYWMQLTADDRLMTSLPLFHINAPAYSTLGSVAARASLVLLPGFSASSVPRRRRAGSARPSSTRIGAMLEILMRQPERARRRRQPDPPLLHRARRPTASASDEIEARFGFEIVCGYALSESPYGLIWRHGDAAVRHARLGAPASRARPRQRRACRRRRTRGRRRRDGELELRNPAIMRGYYEMPDETAAVIVDGWLRTGDLVTDERRRDLHVPRPQEGGDPPPGREPVAGRGRGRARAPSRRRRSRGDRRAVRPLGGGREGVRRRRRRARRSTSPRCTRSPASSSPRFKVPRYIEVVAELPHTPTGRLAKHQLPAERTPAEVDFEATRGQSRP